MKEVLRIDADEELRRAQEYESGQKWMTKRSAPVSDRHGKEMGPHMVKTGSAA